MSEEDSGASTFGDYVIGHLLGKGKFGCVFVAHREGMTYALKVLKPKHTARHAPRFAREARIGMRVSHPNIVKIFDANIDTEHAWIVMEHLQGLELGEWLERKGRLAINEAIRLALGIVAGAAELHRNGIVHRDLKAGNIYVVEDENGAPAAKLIDFGLSFSAAQMGEDDEEARVTDPGTILGTPGYMPLEQMMGSSDLGPPVDIFALGVLLFLMLTGTMPFPTTDLVTILRTLRNQERWSAREVRPDIPLELDRVLQRCLARDPSQRPTADTLASLLKPFAVTEPERTTPPGMSQTLPDRAPDRWTMVVAYVSAVCILIGIGFAVYGLFFGTQRAAMSPPHLTIGSPASAAETPSKNEIPTAPTVGALVILEAPASSEIPLVVSVPEDPPAAKSTIRMRPRPKSKGAPVPVQTAAPRAPARVFDVDVDDPTSRVAP